MCMRDIPNPKSKHPTPLQVNAFNLNRGIPRGDQVKCEWKGIPPLRCVKEIYLLIKEVKGGGWGSPI